MAASAQNIKIEPVNITWAIEEKAILTAVADVAGSLDGTFIELSDEDGTVGFWSDNGDSGTVEPAGSSALDRSIEITTITDDDSATVVAGLLAAAITADSKFTATASGAEVTITAAVPFDVALWVDGDMGVSFQLCQEGGSLDLGLLDGDIETSFEETVFDVTSHQTGTTIKAALRQGNSAEITTVLQETTNSKLNQFFGKATGGEFNPGGTALFGQGRSRQGTNVLVQARRLILKPVIATDDTDNLTFFRAYPLVDSLTFSGENPKLLSVTWRVFDSENIDSNISLFAFGDQTQSGVDD